MVVGREGEKSAVGGGERYEDRDQLEETILSKLIKHFFYVVVGREAKAEAGEAQAQAQA